MEQFEIKHQLTEKASRKSQGGKNFSEIQLDNL